MESALITTPPSALGQFQRQRRFAARRRPGDDQRRPAAQPRLARRPRPPHTAAMSHVLTLVADRAADHALRRRHRARARGRRRAAHPTSFPRARPPTSPAPRRPTPRRSRRRWTAQQIDAIATKARGRRKGLLLADMDSTIVTSETLDELAAYAGLKEKIAAITRRSMNGEIDFSEALRERVAMLKGPGPRRAGEDLGAAPASPPARASWSRRCARTTPRPRWSPAASPSSPAGSRTCSASTSTARTFCSTTARS